MSRRGPRAAATLVFFLSGTLMGACAARMPAIAGRAAAPVVLASAAAGEISKP